MCLYLFENTEWYIVGLTRWRSPLDNIKALVKIVDKVSFCNLEKTIKEFNWKPEIKIEAGLKIPFSQRSMGSNPISGKSCVKYYLKWCDVFIFTFRTMRRITFTLFYTTRH